jgi:hypothetical protein
MSRKSLRTDYVLWTVIVLYTALIYSTLPLVSAIRKALEERWGNDVYDVVYWIFAALAAAVIVVLLRKLRGKRLLFAAALLTLIGLVYWYYLSSMEYPAERIHFLEYGVLGALLLAALRRHSAQWVAAIGAAAAVYWAGLGDESIQWALPDRVGEIRDSLINLFSGALGIAALHFTMHMYRPSLPSSLRQVRALVVMGALTTVLTATFIVNVHGFGREIVVKEPGKIYTSFTPAHLARINQAGFLNKREKRVYENEAVRHLHQREFYFTNDFKARDGTVYRVYDQARFENAVLKTYYGRYLADHADMCSGPLLQSTDRNVAAKVMKQPLVWSDSLESWAAMQGGWTNHIYESRVKSTIVTSYTLKDLLVCAFLIVAALAYAWWKAGGCRPAIR